MRLRPYKKCDDKYIINWFDDEKKFKMSIISEIQHIQDLLQQTLKKEGKDMEKSLSI